MKSFHSSIIFFILTVAAVMLFGCSKEEKEAIAPPAPPVVLVAEATEDTTPTIGEAIATLDGSTNTDVHAQVTGYLIKQAFAEGAEVKQGDLLFEIDPRPFQADLNQAQADLASAQAQLLKSKQDGQTYQTALSSATAAQASVSTAQTNLSETRITAPISGIAGKAIAQTGDLINPGMTLTTISIIDPIKADFTLTEQSYLNNADWLAQINASPLENRPENIDLILADGTPYPRKGRFLYVERPTQNSARSVTAYALFPNPDKILRPGEYARVRGITQDVSGAVLVPVQSVTEREGSQQVVVVKPDNTVEMRKVTTGDRIGSSWVVTNGLKVGEKVVVEGIEKCRSGMLVSPQDYVSDTPDASTNAMPASSSHP